jgi:hypothetical protein
MDTYALLVGVPTVADGITPDGFRSEDRAFQDRIHALLNELLSTEPFSRVRDRVIWLEPRNRRVWGEKIFAAAIPLLDRGALAHKKAAG